ncbi:hypothetical protein GOP47_0014121 [Adiantum capillus-veneris]|uniref:Uncharacterized protein n=1 Tax=Adiantum capillus-veneris TaxID=13818 RepID=A0A9D4UQ42_ADICA|nr:hypothetical protein GOP47_0014121 [Adiantum capillus-veneris]
MATVLVDQQRAGAQVLKGHDACSENAIAMLTRHGLPDGLLPLEDIEEVGFVESTGYFWVKQKKNSSDHLFKAIRTKTAYGKEVSGFIEKQRLKKLAGVKAKELLLWVSIVEIFMDDAHPGQIYFKSAAGLGRWHPASAFSLQQQ